MSYWFNLRLKLITNSFIEISIGEVSIWEVSIGKVSIGEVSIISCNGVFFLLSVSFK